MSPITGLLPGRPAESLRPRLRRDRHDPVGRTQSDTQKPAHYRADRGYDSAELARALRERKIEPRISKRRRASDPIPAGQATREVRRGRRREIKTRDPLARNRWPIERTNAWLKAKRRIATRHDRKANNYLAFIHLGMILILARSF